MNSTLITSFAGIHKRAKSINGVIYAARTPLTSSILGVLLIDQCTAISIDNVEVESIVNKYLPNTRGRSAVIDCQKELIEAGLEEYAKL